MNRFSVLTGVPEGTKGLVREIRVRWALEEMGLPYEEVRWPHPQTKKDEYKKLQPFGQVPYFEDGNIHMFESGAILLYLAQKYNKLLPADEIKRAHALTWMFAAQTSVEPFLFHSFMLNRDPDASEASKAKASEIADNRLQVLSHELGDKEFFSEEFSIAEITMATVLRTAMSSGRLEKYENLQRYLKRIEARPAFQRALNEHLKLYQE